jgi:hypothetical protein
VEAVDKPYGLAHRPHRLNCNRRNTGQIVCYINRTSSGALNNIGLMIQRF